MFVDEYDYKISVSKEMPLQDLYKEYKYYCENFGNRICSQKTFSDRLKNAGFEIIKKNFGRVVNVEK